MAYPLANALRSVAGSAKPSYITTSLSSTYVETTFTVADASTWFETGTNGQVTSSPLGTHGVFTVVVDFGSTSEEHILCSAVNTSTGVVTIWTDGNYNGRGWDGTPKSAHSAGTASNYNCFPFIGGTDFSAIWNAVSNIRQNSTLQVSPPSGVYQGNYPPSVTASVTAATGNGSFVTYTASNSYSAGQIVSVTGLGIASGSSLNVTNQTIVSASSSQFVIQSGTVGVSSGTGTATAYLNISNQYLVVDVSSSGPYGADILLPPSPPDGTMVGVEFYNRASTNQTLNVSTQGSDVFASANTTYNTTSLAKPGQSSVWIYNASSSQWHTYSYILGGTILPISSGGTGTASFSNGAYSIVYYDAANSQLNSLSGNTTTTAQFLQSKGTGSATNAPTFVGSTGTGNVVLAVSPTITGTVAIGNSSGTVTMGNGGSGTVNIVTSGGGGTVNIATASSSSLTLGNSGYNISVNGYLNNISLTNPASGTGTLSVYGGYGLTIGRYVSLTTATGNVAASPITLNSVGTTSVTLPTTGTLATLANSETFTNKTLTSPVISTIVSGSSTLTVPNSAGSDTFALLNASQTLTNKTISGSSNTFSNIPNSATTATASNVVSTIVLRDGSGNFQANKITLNGVSSANTDAATVLYVNQKVSGLISAGYATTSALPAYTYTAGSADTENGFGVGATLAATSAGVLTIDGVAVALNSTILVKNETDSGKSSGQSIYNGLYTLTTLGTGSVAWILTRSTTYDNSITHQVYAGNQIYVSGGSTLANQIFTESNVGSNTDGSIRFGTDFLSFISTTATSYTAGNGINITGSTISAVAGLTNTISVVSSGINLATYGTAGTYGSSTAIPNVTTDVYGRVTVNSTSAVIAPAGTLTGTTLASNVVSSSLTSVGTISSGTWQGSAIGIAYGGTGATTSAGALAAIGASPVVGSTSLVTVGTITTGTWNGGIIPVNYGGTGFSLTAQLGTNQTATPSAVWATSAYSFFGSSGPAAFQTGNSLPTSIGGTGLTSFTNNGAVYANSTSTLTTGTLPIASGGTGTTTSTGSGSVVLATSPTVSGLKTNNLTVTGSTGAATQTRYMGGTSGTAPASGTFQVGDYVVDTTGAIWICTIAGTPGSWVQVGAASGSSGTTSVLASATGTAQTAAISNQLLYTATVAGMYEIAYYAKVTTAATTSSTLGAFSVTTTDVDGNTVTTTGSSSSQNALSGSNAAFISGTIKAYVAAGGAMTFSLGYSSSGATPMAYEYYVLATSPSATAILSVQNTAGKNVLVNGAMEFWQRGTSFTSSSSVQYTADRWCAWGAFATNTGSFQISRIAAGSLGATNNNVSFQYASRIQRVSGQTSTAQPIFGQSLETASSIPFAGQTVTFSFYARAGANYSASGSSLQLALVSNVGAADQNIATNYASPTNVISQSATLTTVWQRYVYSGVIPTNTTGFAVQFQYAPTGTAGSNDYYDITGVQIELGGVATSFSRAAGNYGQELNLCQRYYQTGGGVANATPSFVTLVSSGDTRGFFPLSTTMRATPAVSFNNYLWRASAVGNSGTVLSADFGVITANVTNTQFGILVNSGLSNFNPASTSVVSWGVSTVNAGTQNLTWYASAEL